MPILHYNGNAACQPKHFRNLSFSLRLERHKMTMQMITQECEIISREYLERFLVKEIREICKESKEFEVKSRKEELERIKMKMITIRTRKIFKR